MRLITFISSFSTQLLIVSLFFSTQIEAQTESPRADSSYKKAQSLKENSQYDQALNELLKASRIYESEQNHNALTKVYNSAGLIYLELGELDLSGSYFAQSLSSLEKAPNPEILSYILNNIGMLKQNQNQLDSALIYLQKSLEIKENNIDNPIISSTLNNIACVYIEKENYRAALDNYLISKSIKLQHKDSAGLFLIHTNIANLYGWLEQMDSVKVNLDKGRTYLTKSTELSLISNYLHNYSEYYNEIGNYKQALLYKDSVLAIQDQIFHHKLASELSKHQIEYESEKKDQIIKKEQIKNNLLVETQKREQAEKQALIILLVGLSVFIIFFYFTIKFKLKNAQQQKLLLEEKRKLVEIKLQRKEDERKILEKGIELKSKQLISYSTLTLQKQEIINELRLKLDGFKSSYTNLPDNLISDLKRTLKTGINMDEEWERFKTHFEQVNDSFFTKLTRNYPHLTNIDLRHCAYIKIGLATKEIATLLNITSGSVQKSRVRLKKKMNLEPEQELYQFIQQKI